MTKVKLICLPYAGASAQVYKRWNQQLSNKLIPVPLELSGRGSRYGELLYPDIENAIEDIYPRIRQEINGMPYAIFGHSFGSLLAFELYHAIKDRGEIPLPESLFLSGSIAPHLISQYSNHTYSQPDEIFHQELLKYGLTPPEVLHDQRFAEIFVPIVRNDFRLFQTYVGKDRPRIASEVHVLAGIDDSNLSHEFKGWDRHIEQDRLSFHLFNGGHFFIFDDMTRVIEFINHTIERITSAERDGEI